MVCLPGHIPVNAQPTRMSSSPDQKRFSHTLSVIPGRRGRKPSQGKGIHPHAMPSNDSQPPLQWAFQPAAFAGGSGMTFTAMMRLRDLRSTWKRKPWKVKIWPVSGMV